MPTERAQQTSFHVGAWRVAPRLNRITNDGAVVQIEPKIMQVLVHLAEHPGAVIARDELLDTVWADTVVGDEVVSRAISELRKVFGDDARNPQFIETIPKMGYRLIAPVSFRQGDNLPEPALATGTMADPLPALRPVAPRLPRRWRLAVPAGLLLIAAGVITGLLLQRPDPTPSILLTRTTPLTSFQGAEFHPALSPDGQQVAFIWTGPDNGHLDLHVKTAASETTLQLTDDVFYEYSPAWSPDGTRIAFARSLQGLFVIPALGGPERKLADIGATSRPDVDWSPDNRFLAYTDRADANAPYRLLLLSLETLASHPLTEPPRPYHGDRHPSFSPDGSRLAFVRVSERAGDLYVMSVAGGTPQRLSFDNVSITGVDWTADGRYLVFSSNRGGTFSLWRVLADGGTPEPLAVGGGGDLIEPSLRKDRLVYTHAVVETNIWRLDAAPGAKAERVISSTRRDADPQFSPDGQYVAFTSSRSGSVEIWRSRADGTEPVRLTSFDGPTTAHPRWSPDGRFLAFDARQEGQADIYVVDIASSVSQRLTTNEALDLVPSWSNDGQWIYFASNRSGTWQIWKMAAEGTEAVQVTRHGGFMAQEAANGTLYYTRRDTAGIWQVASASDDESLVLDALQPHDWGNWSLRGGRIYFVRRIDEKSMVAAFDPASGTVSAIATLPETPYWNRSAVTVSPDGRTILYARVDASRHDLMLMDNPR